MKGHMKNKEILVTSLVVYVLTLFMLIAYVKHEVNVIRLENRTYTFAGLMKYDDSGHQIYVPIYRQD